VLLKDILAIKVHHFIIKLLGRDEKIACNDELFVKALKEFGLDMPLDKLVGTLSGGELQRLQLAEYFLVKPEIILLDEPACKLDKTNKDNIYDIIENKYNNVLRIVITHDAVIEYKNGIILEMRDGTICQN
jgi:ABC-type lipoprotein export system ATPase subunit